MATRAELQARGRSALDRRFTGWRQLPAEGGRPHGGWIRAIRDALGMTAEDLAERMGVTQSVVSRIEKSERTGRVQLDTLQRVAEALNCELVYALVPRRDLEELVTERARALALEQLRRVGHTMALEAQAVKDSTMSAKLDLLTEHYKRAPGLWRAEQRSATSRGSATPGSSTPEDPTDALG